MHPQVTYISAQERVADLRAAAERSRRTAADTLLLADGRRLKIRPIEREDRDRLGRLFVRLTPESRYRRFFSPKPELTERELAYLVDIDHVHHEALAAVDESDGSFVAAARYVQRPDQPHTAEVAIEVADDAQRQGIGTELAIQTLQRARANGFKRATATTLHENRPARALLRALHFRQRSRDRHEIEFGLELTPDLATAGSSCRGDPGQPNHRATRRSDHAATGKVIPALLTVEAQLGLAERVSERDRPGRRCLRPETAHQRLGLNGDSITKGPIA